MTASRLITLILLLQRRPNQKAADLARELGVSVRTLHRYLAALDEIGIPVYSERGPNGGFSLVRGYRMPPLVLTPDESVAVYLGAGMVEELWGPLYREAARAALAKIENLLPEEQRKEAAWARRSLVATGFHRGSLDALTPTLETLRQATRQRLQVALLYQGANREEATRRTVDPYALVHRSSYWYAIGYCHLRQAVRSFRLDRILELAPLDSHFDPPEGFDLRAYLAREIQSQPQVTACLRFVPEGARIAQDNRTYWDSLDPQPDGSVIVTFSTPELEWAASTSLAYGPLVEVLSPPELRQMVAEWALAVAQKYTLSIPEVSRA